MARPSKIDQLGLAEKVLSLALTRTSREISAILKAEDKADVSHVAVARYIKGVRQERAEQTKALVQDAIKATVPRDLQILEQVRDQLDDWRRDPKMKIKQKLQVIDRLRKVLDLRLKYSGAGEGPGDLLDAIIAAYQDRTADEGK